MNSAKPKTLRQPTHADEQAFHEIDLKIGDLDVLICRHGKSDPELRKALRGLAGKLKEKILE